MIQNELIKLFDTIGLLNVVEVSDSDLKPIRKGEKEVGVMNDFEKKCVTFISLKKSEQESIQFHAGKFRAGSEEHISHQKRYDILFSVIEAVNGIMWFSIKSRMDIPQDSEEILLRKGFLVVASYEKRGMSENCGCIMLAG